MMFVVFQHEHASSVMGYMVPGFVCCR